MVFILWFTFDPWKNKFKNSFKYSFTFLKVLPNYIWCKCCNNLKQQTLNRDVRSAESRKQVQDVKKQEINKMKEFLLGKRESTKSYLYFCPITFCVS